MTTVSFRPSPAVSSPVWQLELLGAFCLHDGGAVRHTRLHSRQVVALLARLAIHPRRDHPREELVELLWPGVDLATGLRRLRNALSVLRATLEPPGGGHGPVIEADRTSVRLVAGALACDVGAFEQAVAAGDGPRAGALYRGELLPGHYAEWVLVERARLEALNECRAGRPTMGPAQQRPADDSGRRGPATTTGTAAAAAPPERSVDAPPSGCVVTGLPHYPTRLFGIDARAATLVALVQAERLVTLTGPGGAGKSRLAIEVAHRLAASSSDASRPGASGRTPFAAIVRVPLVEANDRRQALDAIHRALRIDLAEPSLDALVARLAGRRTLLLLDNLEQLVDRGAELVGELAAALPELHLLVTSRRSLGLDGSRDWPLAPLDPPPADCDLETAAANPAVALFVDRAIAARLAFRLGRGNRAAIVGIVRAVDGLPLAIELAAARSRAFAPAELLARLTAEAPRTIGGPAEAASRPAAPMLELLARTGPRAAHDARHATMERTIRWSWDLLDPPARRLAGSIAAFRGGCDAAMLQAVLGPGDDAALGLDRLVADSLVQVQHEGRGEGEGDADDADPGTRPYRFRLHEPVRRFVDAELDAPTAREWRARHRAWAAAWVAAMPPTLPIDALRAELPNLCAAFASAAADGAGAADAARLLAGLAPAPEVLTWPVETLRDAARVLEPTGERALRQASREPGDDGDGERDLDLDLDPALRSAAHTVLAMLFYFAGGLLDEATRQADAALASAPPGSTARGRALYPVAVLRWRVGRRPDEVLPVIAEARTLAGADRHLQARLDTLEGFVRLSAGDADPEAASAALRLHERSLALRRTLGNRHAELAGDYNLAHVRTRQRNFDAALAGFASVATAAAAAGDVHLQSRALDAIGECLTGMRRFDEAIDALHASIRLAWRHLHRQALLFNLGNLALPLARRRDPARALTLAAFAAVFWRTTIGAPTASDERERRRVRRLCAVQLSRADFDAAWARGEALALVDAVDLALASRSGGPAAARPGSRSGSVPF